MDNLLSSPAVAKIILEELSNTDNSANHHFLFVGTTNDPEKIKKIRAYQEKEDRNKPKGVLGAMIGDIAGHTADPGEGIMCHDVYDLQTHDCRHPYCWPHVVCREVHKI